MIVTDEDQLVSRSLIKAYFLDGIGMIPRIQHSAIVRFFVFFLYFLDQVKRDRKPVKLQSVHTSANATNPLNLLL